MEDIKFLVDECTGPNVALWLKSQGFITISIYDEFQGKKDFDILKMAFDKNFVIITNDKDFGEMVFKNNLPHKGIVLLRLSNERSSHKIEVLERLFSENILELPGSFTVVSEKTIRIIRQLKKRQDS